MRKAEARRSRANGKRGYQPDENGEVLQLLENRANNVESKLENQTVVAWINGEEIQDDPVGEEVFIFLEKRPGILFPASRGSFPAVC